MKEKIDEERVRLYSSDWRWSATIVGIFKYFQYLEMKGIKCDYNFDDDYIEFYTSDITEENYLLFAEEHFREFMHHKEVEDLIQVIDPTEVQIKRVNEKLSKNTSSNTIMIKTFKGIKYDGQNADVIKKRIDENSFELIKQTFKGGRALYYNFCNENNLLSEKEKSCRIRGYSVDMGKKGKSVSYMQNMKNFVYQDSKYFDFIPFAFSKTREAFFINNNFTIKQLIQTNKDYLLSDKKEVKVRSQLFLKTKESSSFIDYDVEVIKKDRDKDYFETIFVRKKATKIFSTISEGIVAVLSKPCNVKRGEKSQDVWLNIETIVTDSILNGLKIDDLIERLFKAYNDHRFLISHLIRINQMIYTGGDQMSEGQKRAYGAAQEVKKALRGKENKIRSYEQRLISSLTLKDYERVQEVLLHLSAFTQVRMDFLIDVFNDFEANKNLVYTFINVLGEKKTFEGKEGIANG
ncbi:MAG: type I CRISPR-associated protein Cas8a1/Csx8 [Defluviitaleaceae bacterium]|nr:type I CRISPR-associated protein Cas8a1/Csx8 [Defluviitaleaceae bacterium]